MLFGRRPQFVKALSRSRSEQIEQETDQIDYSRSLDTGRSVKSGATVLGAYLGVEHVVSLFCFSPDFALAETGSMPI